MISTFNLEKLHSLLQDFYHITRIRITVFNEHFEELTSYPEHIAPICQLIRTDSVGRARCHSCDEEACKRAAKYHTAYTYRCHAGLTESIIPLYLGNIIVGYLLFGHVFSFDSHESGRKTIEENCRDLRIDKEILRAECTSMPIHSDDYIRSASHILNAVASYLCLERMASVQRETLPVRIDEYIQAHFTEEIDVPDIAAAFRIGKTKIYEIAKQSYGCGIAEHIRSLRIQKAKQLLQDTNLSLAEIASQCGFKDYNYFIVVFKRSAGMPPKAYQASLRANKEY